jgi:hypothetical protein
MSKVIKPVSYERANPVSVFLAGTIEMGKAVDWQKQLEAELSDVMVDIFNPRRDDWDASWEQSINNPQFLEQVTWELDHLDEADIIFLYFVPGMMSPISLLEFGLYAKTGKLVVVCPDGFWRQGNVEVVCKRYNIPFFKNLGDGILKVRNIIVGG